jgi:hypothetical protein
VGKRARPGIGCGGLAGLPIASCLAISACGRIGFDVSGGGVSGDAVSGDATSGSCPSGEAIVAGACYPALASDPALVAYWPLDEPAGAKTFRDVSPNANTGQCTACPTAGVPGVRHNAAQYSSNAAIGIGMPSSITTLSSGLTVLGWANIPAYAFYGYILSNDRDCCGTYSGFSLWSSHYSGNLPTFQLWDDLQGTKILASGSGALSLNQWHFIAGTFDGATANLYVDGQLAGTLSGVTLTAPPSFATELGSMGVNPPNYANDGTIDELMIFSRALTATEIADLYAYYKAL